MDRLFHKRRARPPLHSAAPCDKLDGKGPPVLRFRKAITPTEVRPPQGQTLGRQESQVQSLRGPAAVSARGAVPSVPQGPLHEAPLGLLAPRRRRGPARARKPAFVSEGAPWNHPLMHMRRRMVSAGPCSRPVCAETDGRGKLRPAGYPRGRAVRRAESGARRSFPCRLAGRNGAPRCFCPPLRCQGLSSRVRSGGQVPADGRGSAQGRGSPPCPALTKRGSTV